MAGGRRKGKSGAFSSVTRRRLKIKKRKVVPAAYIPRYESNPGGFFPDDILNEILLRLPTGASIVRFRCVCKSWNRLLSNPRSIHSILFNPDVNSAGNEETAQVLIAGIAYSDNNRIHHTSSQYVYSLLHYSNLKIITPIDNDPVLPSVPNKVRSYTFPDEGIPVDFGLSLSIVGFCDGIICIADKLCCTASDIILWNPSTSETRILPRSPFSGHRTGPDDLLFVETLGFGFDSETNDYKIIRSIDALYIPIEHWKQPKRQSWSLVEVYSLKNDSWKRVNGQYSLRESNPVRYPYWYRGEKLYWWESDREGTQLSSWDMGKEEFDSITFFPNPTGKDDWVGHSFTLLKDSIVGVFSESRDRRGKDPFDIRVLLKFDGAVAWTLLYSVPGLVNASLFTAIWKDGMYFVDPGRCSPFEVYRGRELFIFDPETGRVGDLGILDKFDPEIVAFVPSKVSLSGFKVEEDGDD